MDDLSLRLVLDSPSMLPSSAEPLHVLLSTSFSSIGVLATAEIQARSNDLLSCKLQFCKVTKVEAHTGLACALFINTDSITYISTAALCYTVS